MSQMLDSNFILLSDFLNSFTLWLDFEVARRLFRPQSLAYSLDFLPIGVGIVLMLRHIEATESNFDKYLTWTKIRDEK
jgi:hypothetical protein